MLHITRSMGWEGHGILVVGIIPIRICKYRDKKRYFFQTND